MAIRGRPASEVPGAKRWRRRIALLGVALLGVAAAAYMARCALLLDVATIVLNHDADLVAQERADGVAIVFAEPPPGWISPMKNVMNPIWQPIGATGVNYYTFAGPSTVLRPYSERSNPSSPYYQAWVGGYVTKRLDGTLPADLPAWATQVTELDQRSWLAAMGDPHPLADFSAPPTATSDVVIDGRTLRLWHGTMHSHSDLSDGADSMLARLIGMTPKASWPSGIRSFHDLTLDGYFVCWPDSVRNVSVVLYAVAVIPAARSAAEPDASTRIQDQLLRTMKAAKLVSVL